MAKVAKSKIYFGPEVEQAIIEFNAEIVPHRKEQIFNKRIYPPLNKLIENVINTWKFWRYETTYQDLKSDLVSFLYERLHLIEPKAGKAYSYLTICIKHYCIKKNQDLYKEMLRQGEMEDVDEERNIGAEQYRESYQEDLKDFIALWAKWCLKYLEQIFKSKNDRKVAEAIITLFLNSGDVELYNKKELYILIREHSKLETQYITRVSQALKEMFFKMFEDYRITGKIETDLYL